MAEFSISGSVDWPGGLPGPLEVDTSILAESLRAAGYSLPAVDLLNDG